MVLVFIGRRSTGNIIFTFFYFGNGEGNLRFIIPSLGIRIQSNLVANGNGIGAG